MAGVSKLGRWLAAFRSLPQPQALSNGPLVHPALGGPYIGVLKRQHTKCCGPLDIDRDTARLMPSRNVKREMLLAGHPREFYGAAGAQSRITVPDFVVIQTLP